MKTKTLPRLLTLLLSLALPAGGALAADPGLWWEVQLTEDGDRVEITVSTAELPSDRTLTQATCQVAFLSRKGLLGTQLYAFPMPLEAGVEKSETFSHVYGDKVQSVTGPEMKYTVSAPTGAAGTGAEESEPIAARTDS